MTTMKDKAAAFVAAYQKELATIQEKISQTEQRLEDIQIEIRFLGEKEIPEAVQRRVLTGDKQQESKVRKALEKLQKEYQEKSEDLVVIQNMLNRYKQQKADEIKPLQRLFQEEQRAISQERYDRIVNARNAYKQAINTETDLLHLYRSIEVDLQSVEVNAGRRRYVETVFPLDSLKLNSLAVKPDEVARIAKRIK
jgi:predicted  nucleic acid-binding Zn-ribbon protein